MQKYIAILRGINVSGQKMIKMEALKAHLEALNFKNITTYIQSGNVIFEYEEVNQSDLANQIVGIILQKCGFQVPVLVKDASYFEKVLKNNPFVNPRNEDINKLHVTFLASTPEKGKVEKIPLFENTNDEFVVLDDFIYLFCPNGYGNTKLNNTFFENKLKVTAITPGRICVVVNRS